MKIASTTRKPLVTRVSRPGDRLPIALLITISVAVFGFLFYQSFWGADVLDLVTHRDECDGYFHETLRRIHTSMQQLSWRSLLSLNEYAYGWIFWFPIGLLTYPFYLLSLAGNDRWLIAVPSQISLVLTFGGVYFALKTVSLYTNSWWTRTSATCLIFTFCCFGYLSLEFHPTALTFFLNSLALYIAARPVKYDYRDLTKIAVTFGASVGAKLTAAFFGPILLLLLLDRTGPIGKDKLKKFLFFGLVFLFTFVFTMSPATIVFVGNPSVRNELLRNLSSVVGAVSANPHIVEHDNPLFLFNQIVLMGFLGPVTTLFCFVALVYKAIVDRKAGIARKNDFLFFLVTLAIVITYLCFRVKSYTFYTIPYYYPVAFLLVFSLCALDNWRRWHRGLVFAIPLLTVFLNAHQMDPKLSKLVGRTYAFFIPYRYLEWRVTQFSNQRNFAMELREKFKPLAYGQSGSHVLMDERLPMPYRAPYHPHSKLTTITCADEIDPHTQPKVPYRYVVLYKKALYLGDEARLRKVYHDEITRILNIPSITNKESQIHEINVRKEKALTTRQFYQTFMQTRTLHGCDYQLQKEGAETLVFEIKNDCNQLL